MKIINFSRGVPAEESFPVSTLKRATKRSLDRDWQTILQYGPAFGYWLLRQWIADWQKRPVGEVLVANGSLEILKFICEAFLRPGDTVFVESPTYDRTLTILRSHGVKIVGIPLEADGPNIDVLQERLAEREPVFFYVIPDFQNPTGVTWSLEKRAAVGVLARRRKFAIIEDSPYRLLRYAGEDVQSLSTIAPNVWRLGSFTKLIAAGIRVGFLVADPDVIEQVAMVAENTYITPGFLAQGAVYEWCQDGRLDPQIASLRKLYAPRLDACLETLDQYLPGCVIARPEGGFFVSVRLPEGMTNESLRSAAQGQSLVLSNGQGFFPNPVDGQNFLRLPFCALSPDDIREGISRLANIVHNF